MSTALLSVHVVRRGDQVSRTSTAMLGDVQEAGALYASIRWEDGRTEEVEQGDPDIRVERRAPEGVTEEETEEAAALGMPVAYVRGQFDSAEAR